MAIDNCLFSTSSENPYAFLSADRDFQIDGLKKNNSKIVNLTKC